MKTFVKITASLGVICALTACGEQIDDDALDISPEIAVYDANKTDKHIIEWIETERAAGKSVSFVNPLDAAGVEFVKLALQLGQLDGDYVDAYQGPSVWAEEAKELTPDPIVLATKVQSLRTRLADMKTSDESSTLRKEQLQKILRAMTVRLDVVQGKTVRFDEEVKNIYDVEPPVYDMAIFDSVLEDIDALLPGEGTTADRVDAFRNTLAIPKDKLEPVFQRAIEECRARTAKYYDLPETETFRMEFVTDKAWSGYNYYQGNYESLIQINTDFPIIIDRAVDLGCHEGYPGHHVWGMMNERDIVKGRGWIEYSVSPLFWPFGPIAEGSGNYGIKLAFPGDEKIEFEKSVLFPMAGLDPLKADTLIQLNALTRRLSQATNEISRQYLDGKLTRQEAIPLIQKYGLRSEARAAQSTRFTDKYRAYVINYNIGQDWVEKYVTAAGDDPEAQWAAFRGLLVTPMTTSDIQDALKK